MVHVAANEVKQVSYIEYGGVIIWNAIPKDVSEAV